MCSCFDPSFIAYTLNILASSLSIVASLGAINKGRQA